MQQRKNHKHIRLDLIDADGCIYHEGYRNLLNWLFGHYGEIFAALDQQRIAARKNKFTRTADINITMQHIFEELQSLDLTALSRQSSPEMIQEITQRGKERISNLSEREQRFFGAEYYETQMRYYLNALYLLDSRILQTILTSVNPDMMQHLSADATEYDLHYLGIGSNRQSQRIDILHMSRHLTGSIFSDVMYLARQSRNKQKPWQAHIALQPLTMADLASGQPNGESFRRIISHPAGDHENCLCDRSKLALLYMMAHDTARRHPESKITINVYDNDPRILDGLYDRLHEKPGSDLLPASVHVVLQPYDGKLGTSRVIQGSGPVDYDFRENLRYLISMAQMRRSNPILDSVDTIKDVNLDNFLATRKINHNGKTLAVMLDADGCIYNYKYFYLVLKLIDEHSREIKNTARKFEDSEKAKEFGERLIHEIKSQDLSQITEEKYLELLDRAKNNWKCSVSDDDLMGYEDSYLVRPGHAVVRQYLRYLQEIDPAIGATLLYHANQDVFTHVVDRAKQQGCARIVFLVGSNRQSVDFDNHNSKTNGTNSFYADLRGLVGYLGQHYKDEVAIELDKFLLADVYGDINAGESFQLALHNPQRLPHAGAVFDESKTSLVYGIMHHIARYYPETCAVEFYDDLPSIFSALVKAFGDDDKHRLLPRLPLDLILHNGADLPTTPICSIRGNGATDENLYRSLRLMLELCGVDLAKVHQVPSRADVAATLSLKTFADKRREDKPAMDAEFESLISIETAHAMPKHNMGFFTAGHVEASISGTAVNTVLQMT